MVSIKWCKEQLKGVRLVAPNENIAKQYLEKAANALKAKKVLKNNVEWEVSSAYYAQYFSVYALLAKIGIKSEIHSCTITIVEELLKKYFTKNQLKTLQESLVIRINVQYYLNKIPSNQEIKVITDASDDMYTHCVALVDSLTTKEIETIRKTI